MKLTPNIKLRDYQFRSLSGKIWQFPSEAVHFLKLISLTKCKHCAAQK